MKKYEWINVNYWTVSARNNRTLFRGTKKECQKRVDKSKGQFVANVILEKQPIRKEPTP